MMAAVLLALLDNNAEEGESAFIGPNPGKYGKGDEGRGEEDEGRGEEDEGKGEEDEGKGEEDKEEEGSEEDSKTIPVASANDITGTKDTKYLVFLVFFFHPADILLLRLALVILNPSCSHVL
jgi:hypothetical protein